MGAVAQLLPGRHILPFDRRPRLSLSHSATSRCCSLADNDSGARVQNTQLQVKDNGPTDCITSPEDQALLCEAARLVLDRAKAVLHEKVQDYDNELTMLEKDADRNLVYRALYSWTIRLLRRKKEFVTERIQTMDELAASVESCSLDRTCTFMLRSTADLEELKLVVSSTLDGTLSSLNQGGTPPSLEVFKSNLTSYEQRVEKDLAVKVPPLTWSVHDEARDLEDALWEASLVAAKMEGASVQVQKSYSSVASAYCRDTAGDEEIMKYAFEWANKSLNVGMDPDEMATLSETNVALEVALQAIFKVISASIACSFVAWLFGLEISLDEHLHWANLVPTNLQSALSLVLWTLPLAISYAILGGLRGIYPEAKRGGVTFGVSQCAAFAADRLQASGRTLQYAITSTPSDMRVLYFLATLESVCCAAPLLWGVLPGVVMKLGAPFGGWLFKGAAAPRLVQVPFIALGVAASCGVGSLISSAGSDTVDRDARRDETQYIDSLLRVKAAPVAAQTDVTVSKFNDGQMEFRANIGSNAEVAERRLQEIAGEGTASDAGEMMRSVQKSPPSSITLDFLSAATQRAVNSRQEWIGPTAVMASSFYLCLESLATGEIAFAAFTQIISIYILDVMNRPWDCVSMSIQVVVTPEGREGPVVSRGKKLGD